MTDPTPPAARGGEVASVGACLPRPGRPSYKGRRVEFDAGCHDANTKGAVTSPASTPVMYNQIEDQ